MNLIFSQVFVNIFKFIKFRDGLYILFYFQDTDLQVDSQRDYEEFYPQNIETSDEASSSEPSPDSSRPLLPPKEAPHSIEIAPGKLSEDPSQLPGRKRRSSRGRMANRRVKSTRMKTDLCPGC